MLQPSQSVAKKVFELAVADGNWRVIERARLTRSQFEHWFANRKIDLVVMEACGSAHHWGRWLRERGIAVKLLPAQYVRAYVKRNKTDAADALEEIRLLEARIEQLERELAQIAHRSPFTGCSAFARAHEAGKHCQVSRDRGR